MTGLEEHHDLSLGGKVFCKEVLAAAAVDNAPSRAKALDC